MSRLSPFRALHLLGGAVENEPPALHVMEVDPSPASGGRPVRYLLGASEPRENLDELEDEPRLGYGAEPIPVLAADDQNELRDLLTEVAARGAFELETSVGASRVRIWRVADRRLQQRLLDALEGIPLRPTTAHPSAGHWLAAVVPLSDPGVCVRPFHRAIRGLETFREDTFLKLVAAYARVYDLEESLLTAAGRSGAEQRLASHASGQHAVLLALPGGRAKILRFRQALELTRVRAAPRSPTLRSLDLALLNALVLRTVLGIHEPERSNHPQVSAVEGFIELAERVNEGVFQAGFALNPPPAWEIRAVMEASQRLPPRTLRIEPALPPGLLLLQPEP